MDSERKITGDRGEHLAAAFLRSRGFRILERQARISRTGEIDLIALDGETFVFVEVKTRRNPSFGSPEEAVTPSKLRRMAACAEGWRNANGLSDRPYRIDVVGIELSGGKPIIRHLENVGD